MNNYTVKIIPGKYLLLIDEELTTFDSPYDVARTILVDFHKREFNEDITTCAELLEEMAGDLAQNKIVMLPLGTWAITREELLECGE